MISEEVSVVHRAPERKKEHSHNARLENSEGHRIQGSTPSSVVCARAIVRLGAWNRQSLETTKSK